MFASSNIRAKLNIKWNSNQAMLECMENDELRMALIKYAATKVNLGLPQKKIKFKTSVFYRALTRAQLHESSSTCATPRT